MAATYRVVIGDDPAAARRLRDAGFEVIVAGVADARVLAEVCLQEDADAVWPPVEGLADALAARGLGTVVVADPHPDRVLAVLSRP